MRKLPVFVYGTLRKGHGNYRLLAGRTVDEARAVVDGILHAAPHGGFPCAVEGDGVIVGELMFIGDEVFDETMYALDMLEGYHENNPKRSMYLRKVVTATTPQGEDFEAYMYFWNYDRVGDLIPSGDWNDYERPRIGRG